MADTSTSLDRSTFISLYENGRGDATAAARVSQCTIALPDHVAALAGLPRGSTFAQAAAKIAGRSGQVVQPLLA